MDPVTTIVSSIISSIINAAMDAPPAPPPAPAYTSMARNFPADSLKGELLAPLEGDGVQISGKRFSKAPALQIRNEQNLIVMPASLQGTLPVRYQLDPLGSVWRVWILSSAESQ